MSTLLIWEKTALAVVPNFGYVRNMTRFAIFNQCSFFNKNVITCLLTTQ